MMSTSRRGKAGLGEPHAAAKTNQHQYRSAPVFEPTISTRFACLSRLLKYLGGHLKSLKLFKIQHNVALKRLASAVQLRPWPPCFQSLSQILSVVPVRSQSAFLDAPKTVAVAASC